MSFRSLPVIAVLLSALGAMPASAAVLYDNGGNTETSGGFYDGWNISQGLAVSNSFTLTKASIITGVNFGILQSPFGGGDITTLAFGITSTANSYPVTSNASVTTGAQTGTGEDFWILRTDSFSTGNIALGPGTYYLVLQNAVETGQVDFWTENDGPSTASIGGISNGAIGSESFQILGVSAVPEPSTWAMMILGFCGVGFMAYRKKAALSVA